MSFHQVVRLAITALQAPANYARGRFFYMYRPTTKMMATYVSHAIGKLLLPPPIFTKDEWEACPTDQRAKLGVGPVPQYMKDEFFYWKTDRSPHFNDNHYQDSLLLADYRNRVYKTLSWRCFLVGVLFCGGVIVASNSAVWLLSSGEHLGHKLMTAIHGENSVVDPTTTDDTQAFIPPDLKTKLDAVASSTAALTDEEQAHIADTTTCGVFLADLVNGGNALRRQIDLNSVALMAERKIGVCQKSGYQINRILTRAILPLRGQVSVATYESLLAGSIDTHAPDSFTNDESNKLDGGFDTCDQDLQTLRAPTPPDHTTAAFLARRYNLCAANGHATIPTSP